MPEATRGPDGDRLNGQVEIGSRLRAARRQLGLSLEEVADATQLTKGFLSQLERDQTSPSVASLVRICAVLRLRVGELFDPAQTNLVRASDRPRINFGGENVTEFLLSPDTESRIQVIEAVVGPGGSGGDELYTLPAEAEFAHVKRGKLEITVSGETYRLGPGDSMTFSPKDPHSWRNPSSKADAIVLWVMTPSPY